MAPTAAFTLAAGQFPNRHPAGSSTGTAVTLLEGSPLSPVQGGPRKVMGKVSTGMNCTSGEKEPPLQEG